MTEFDYPLDAFDEPQETAADPVDRIGSLLTVDIGSINTKAALFDQVEGHYRFLVAGKAATTANAPLYNVSEGIKLALDHIREVSGRQLTNDVSQIITPPSADGAGTDFLAVTFSAGAPLKTVVVGLLGNVSMASVVRLADTTYSEIIETIGLNDHRAPEEQIDTIQKLNPDVILIAGGTDGGAHDSVLDLVNAVGLALHLLPEDQRPEVLYAGNPDLSEQVLGFLEPLASIQIAPNIRPDLAAENLGAAQTALAGVFRRIHTRRVQGIYELDTWSGGNLVPTSHGFGRVVRFFSRIIPNAKTKGVLGIDVGAASTVVSGSFNGDLRTKVISGLGIGTGLNGILEGSQMENILRWIPLNVTPHYVLEYIQNKIIHPGTVPATSEDLYIEQALAREIIRRAMGQAIHSFPKNARRIDESNLPDFDPILVGGAVLANAPSPAHSLLIILDALQPVGIQRIILDNNYLASGLGAAAALTPGLVAQLLLDPTAFLNLGFVISPITRARPGSAVLRVRIQYEGGHESVVNVIHGSIQTIPLAIGQRARLLLDPLNRANIGFGPGRGTAIQVVGGPFGVVVDARGRPLELPANPNDRRNLLLQWEASFQKLR